MKILRLSAVITAIFILAVPAFAKVGTHNGYITFNGGFSSSVFGASDYLINNSGGAYQRGYYVGQFGGAVGFDAGYQFFSPGKFVQGVDLVIGMNANFERSKGVYNGTSYTKATAEEKKQGITGLRGYISSTYSLGAHGTDARFMFDIIGLQLSFGELDRYNPNAKPISQKTDTVFNIGFNMPLGFRIVTDNGFIFGFRHAVSMNILYKGVEKDGMIVSLIGDENGNMYYNWLNYTMMFSIGVAFGK